MTSPLFRPEAVAHLQEAKMGDAFHIHHATRQWFTAVLVLLAIAIILFLCWGEYSRKARVSGFLTPTQGLVKVFTPQTGTVIERRIDEGQKVNKGDVLFVLSSDRASLSSNDAQAAAMDAISARRDSLLNELEQQDDLNRIEWQDLQTQQQRLQHEMQQLEREIAVQQQRVAMATATSNKFKQLFQQHFVAEIQWQEKQEQLLAQQATLESLKRDQVNLARQRDALHSRISASRFEFARQRAELDRQISSHEQQLTEYEAQRSTVITAPASGTVSAILLQPGQIANQQSPLLTIVPEGSELQANLLVPSRAIGFITPGQSVALRYEAFPFQRFGLQPGQVKEISRTLIKPGEADFPVVLNEPAYRVIVTPLHQSLQAYTRTVPLQSGMLLDADINLDRRTLLQWVFDPLYSLSGTL